MATYLKFRGERLTMREWARKPWVKALHLTETTIERRFARTRNAKKALTTPCPMDGRSKRRVVTGPLLDRVKKLAREGMAPSAVARKVRRPYRTIYRAIVAAGLVGKRLANGKAAAKKAA